MKEAPPLLLPSGHLERLATQPGLTSVYVDSDEHGVVRYVGVGNLSRVKAKRRRYHDFKRSTSSRRVVAVFETGEDAARMEAAVIRLHGLETSGGNLFNRRHEPFDGSSWSKHTLRTNLSHALTKRSKDAYKSAVFVSKPPRRRAFVTFLSIDHGLGNLPNDATSGQALAAGFHAEAEYQEAIRSAILDLDNDVSAEETERLLVSRVSRIVKDIRETVQALVVENGGRSEELV